MGAGIPCTQALLDAGACYVPEPHPSIFLLRTAAIDFDGLAVALSFCVLVIMTIAIEQVFEMVERAVHKRAAVFSLVGEKIVKELMILGLISFSIFVGEQAFHLNATSFYLPLEFAHIVIFVLAIFYVTEALYFLYLSDTTCTHYDSCLAMKKADIERQLINEWGEDARAWRGTWYQALRWRWSRLHEIVDMQIIHAIFIKKHRLPEQFDFGRYLIHSFDEEVRGEPATSLPLLSLLSSPPDVAHVLLWKLTCALPALFPFDSCCSFGASGRWARCSISHPRPGP